jgi:hypothetical protein
MSNLLSAQASPITAYVSIRNTDGKLNHVEWVDFYNLVDEMLNIATGRAAMVFGKWHSLPLTPYVNACWAVLIPAHYVEAVKDELGKIAKMFRQDSIAFAVAETEFITPIG